MPKKIAPSTDRIRSASGKNEVARAQTTLWYDTARISGGSFGARLGLSEQRITT
jgi:hypothetical protein